MMPQMNGRDMLAALRKSGNRVPIIMHFTGAEDQADAKSFRRAGADEVVPKGRSLEQLLQAIARLLATRNVPPLLSVPPITAPPAPATILVVDDEAQVLVDLKAGLARRGYAVILASNGNQGLDLARSCRPNLVITDFVMPLMDGSELISEIRAAGLTLPIIMYCAGISVASRDLVIRLGAQEVIDKEARVEDLYAAVARLVKKEE